MLAQESRDENHKPVKLAQVSEDELPKVEVEKVENQAMA